mgnify:CR=1 FL=1|jgi:phosphoribosylformimino-5-aminoimidazole carboxamide ribotide isomerase
MIVYPVLQLQEGRCVSLTRGALDTPTVWHGDPVEKAQAFVEQGAEWLHVTDLDAVAGAGSNAALVREIILKAGVPVQVAGGMRSDEAVRGWLEAGAGRIVFGSSAARMPDWVKAHAKAVPDMMAVSIDVLEGRVMVDGWKEAAAFGPQDMVRAYEGTPLAAVIVTDIDRDLDLPESSFALTTRLAEETRTPIIASGLVKSIDDVSTLRHLPNIAGVMIGRALHDRTIDLAEAIEVAAAAPERTAEFL